MSSNKNNNFQSNNNYNNYNNYNNSYYNNLQFYNQLSNDSTFYSLPYIELPKSQPSSNIGYISDVTYVPGCGYVMR